MNDFRSKNFNYLVLKRGDEKHFSFLFRKALHTVVYICKNVMLRHKNHNNFVIALFFYTPWDIIKM